MTDDGARGGGSVPLLVIEHRYPVDPTRATMLLILALLTVVEAIPTEITHMPWLSPGSDLAVMALVLPLSVLAAIVIVTKFAQRREGRAEIHQDHVLLFKRLAHPIWIDWDIVASYS